MSHRVPSAYLLGSPVLLVAALSTACQPAEEKTAVVEPTPRVEAAQAQTLDPVDACSSATYDVTFAAVGDFGKANGNEWDVAQLVNQTFCPDFVITMGDNDYQGHECYPTTVGAYYGDYGPSQSGIDDSCYGTSNSSHKTSSRSCDSAVKSFGGKSFFPSPGNHDTHGSDNTPFQHYLDYFTWASNPSGSTVCTADNAADIAASLPSSLLPNGAMTNFSCPGSGNDVFYDIEIEGVRFFSLNSECLANVTGVDDGCYNVDLACSGDYSTFNACQQQYCAQAAWMGYAVAQNPSDKWRVASFHHSPFTTEDPTDSDGHVSCKGMEWDYPGMGISTVITGHSHYYERFKFDRSRSPSPYLYFVNGIGGESLDPICQAAPEIGEANGQSLYSVHGSGDGGGHHGAMRLRANDSCLEIGFWSTKDASGDLNPTEIDKCYLYDNGSSITSQCTNAMTDAVTAGLASTCCDNRTAGDDGAPPACS
ncbi:MAG: hypothetical protein AAF657_03635 [Acidobacteriota bacterium]